MFWARAQFGLNVVPELKNPHPTEGHKQSDTVSWELSFNSCRHVLFNEIQQHTSLCTLHDIWIPVIHLPHNNTKLRSKSISACKRHINTHINTHKNRSGRHAVQWHDFIPEAPQHEQFILRFKTLIRVPAEWQDLKPGSFTSVLNTLYRQNKYAKQSFMHLHLFLTARHAEDSSITSTHKKTTQFLSRNHLRSQTPEQDCDIPLQVHDLAAF